VLSTVAVLCTVSALVFGNVTGWSPVDAIYFTITTVSTVGYGDINLSSFPDPVKIYDVIFMLFGATALAAFYALVTDAIVGARISAALGVPHGKIKNHVVVCGLGNVGCSQCVGCIGCVDCHGCVGCFGTNLFDRCRPTPPWKSSARAAS